MAWFKKERKSRTSERVRLEIPADAWEKCDECGHIDIKERFVRALNVCPSCGYHRRISAQEYIDLLVDEGSWHELTTTDAPAALKFYSDVFGWRPSDTMDMGPMGKYHMFNRPHGMIGGMMNKPPEMAHVPPHWMIYFRVPDINAAVERIKANGGKILNGPMEVPGGRIAQCLDPQGAAFALHWLKED